MSYLRNTASGLVRMLRKGRGEADIAIPDCYTEFGRAEYTASGLVASVVSRRHGFDMVAYTVTLEDGARAKRHYPADFRHALMEVSLFEDARDERRRVGFRGTLARDSHGHLLKFDNFNIELNPR